MGIEQKFDLSGKVAVVTGGGRGIGEGIAHAFVDAGAAVVLAARRADDVARVCADIQNKGGKALAVPTDVTSNAALQSLAQQAIDQFGGLHIWVNNAGGSRARCPLTELSRDDWDAAVALNLTAVWEASVIAAKSMDRGVIINISSRAAYGPVPLSGHYAALKAGVNSLTETLAAELGPRIKVNGIAPGLVPTEVMMDAMKLTDADLPALEKNANLPAGRLGTPQDIGACALYLAADASEWMTGQTLVITGGM